jgi:hypothetical protein
MRKLRRFGPAIVLAAFVAVGMTLNPALVEAKGKSGGGDTHEAVCSYLLTIIHYQYIDQSIQYYVIKTYLAYGCDPSLL